jgi:hypothetical protein
MYIVHLTFVESNTVNIHNKAHSDLYKRMVKRGYLSRVRCVILIGAVFLLREYPSLALQRYPS